MLGPNLDRCAWAGCNLGYMAKGRKGADRASSEAARRARAAGRLGAAREVDEAVQLLRDAEYALDRLAERRTGVLAGRGRAVDSLRAAGWSWSAIAHEAGVSRQALMKR